MRRAIPQMEPTGVVFDMDGVLCDTREYHLTAFQELCRTRGRSLTAEEFQHLFGMENGKLIPKLFGAMDAGLVQELADWKEARYRELIASQIGPMPGVVELIDWLESSGRPIAVASSAPRANVMQILASTGLADRFRAVFGQEDVTRHKPDPEVFLRAAEAIGSDPRSTWVIEDSLHGIEAGRAAGMTVLAVATTHPAGELAIADAVFSSVAEILEAVRNK